MPVALDLPVEILQAIDGFAAAEMIHSRQQAIATLLAKALEDAGHLPHKPEVGTRPEDLTTANDD
ncbi:hypothetical protein [Aureimonas sp. AU12]|uniref:hypothetical protein n=1 Tax=Aureimonas sp. AU12 TaxID=1638161 RepID=UPI00078464F9|nr:hypothetical protein [Aureimonas sp. AU12]